MILVSDLLQILCYFPETGKITWRINAAKNVKKGNVAGCVNNHNYITIGINKKVYKAHRVAWAMHYGQWPELPLDHINGIKSDNRIANLREATHSENMANTARQSNNKSGYKGVSWCKRRSKWMASISINGRKKNLGYFLNIHDASSAYCAAAASARGDFVNFG